MEQKRLRDQKELLEEKLALREKELQTVQGMLPNNNKVKKQNTENTVI